MKLSLDWINDYVDITDIDPEELAHKLTMTTAEVEELIPVKRRLKNVIVGEIISVKTVVAARGISEIMVNCGDHEIRTITTTQELQPGIKIAFATLGAALNENLYVQLKEIAGVESRGKLCTPNDLCLGEFNDYVVHLPTRLKNGTCLSDIITETDTLLDIDNHSLTHRPDLWGHYGFAREISAILQRPLKPLNLWESIADSGLKPIDVESRDQSICPVYNCIRLSDLTASHSSPVIQSRLNILGQRAVNLIVDLTNYVMLETGQPLHAFDGDRVKAISVDLLNKNCNLVTLDGTERKLQEKDPVILDQKDHPVAIAGVIGGYDSQVTSKTNTVLLESANFKGSAIRKAANRLNLATEASRRFEKQQPPAVSVVALRRLVYLLLKEQPAATVKSQLTTKGDLKEKTRFLEIPLDFFCKRMGTAITVDAVKQNLTAIGFSVSHKNKKIRVGIPSFRSQADIAIPEDILEEVARLHGYDSIVPVLPPSPMTAVSRDPHLELEQRIRVFLAYESRFQEVQTYNWFNCDILPLINHHPKGCIRVLNPVSPNTTQLRDSILPNLLMVMRLNADYHYNHNIFEIGHVFHDDQESRSVAALSTVQQSGSEPEDLFLNLKGVLETLFQVLDIPSPEFVLGSTEQDWDREHLKVNVGEQQAGRMGLMPSDISNNLVKDSMVAWFEMDLDTLVDLAREQREYKPIPKYPGSWFDFSVLFPDDVLFKEIDDRLNRYENDLLKKRRYLYKYKGDEIRENMTSYTYRYELAAENRTLSSEDLDGFHNSLVGFFDKEGIQVR